MEERGWREIKGGLEIYVQQHVRLILEPLIGCSTEFPELMGWSVWSLGAMPLLLIGT
jgi:hypothetical protein